MNRDEYFELISQTEEYRDKIIRDILEEEEYLEYLKHKEAEIIVTKNEENEENNRENRNLQSLLPWPLDK